MNNLKQLVGGLIFTGFMPFFNVRFCGALLKWRENHRVEYTMMRSGEAPSCYMFADVWSISPNRQVNPLALEKAARVSFSSRPAWFSGTLVTLQNKRRISPRFPVLKTPHVP